MRLVAQTKEFTVSIIVKPARSRLVDGRVQRGQWPGEGVERAHYQSTPNIGGFDPQLQVVFPPSANYMRLISIIH